MGLIALCLTSSLNYIINDLRDREKDRLHPEKSSRPLPSGKISVNEATLLFILLLIIVMIIVLMIPTTSEMIELFVPESPESGIIQKGEIINASKTAFFLVLVGMFITSQLYSLLLKQVVFADIVTISLNYVWRAIAGAVLISVSVSPWLIILCFITAMMLSLAKRKGDLALLGEDAAKHKAVFSFYTADLLSQSLATVTAIEILAIFIYLIERHPKETVFIVMALPLITFSVFRFLFLVSQNSVAGRRAEKLFLDKQLMFAGIILMFLFFMAIYFPNFLDTIMGIPDPA
jgi:4-hydroxybenzoate polyprenyltransferase